MNNQIRTFIANTNTWYLFLRSTDLLNKIKPDNAFDQTVINALLIQSAAAYVEGAFKSLLINHIYSKEYFLKATDSGDVELKRFLDNSINEILKLSWIKLKYTASKVHELNLKALEKNITIKWLFDFRNTLAHGGIIQKRTDIKSTDQNDQYKLEFNNKKALIKYLKKNQLITGKLHDQIVKWDLLNTSVALHFVEQAKLYIKNIYKEYKELYPTNNRINDDYGLIFNSN